MGVRQLTDSETQVWAATVNDLVGVCPYFVKTLGVLRPAVDKNCETVYTDPYGRVALAPRFFTTLPPGRRAGWVLHEALHLINNHFERSAAAGHTDPDTSNIAGDLEINQLIRALAGSRRDTIGIDLPEGVAPTDYGVPPGLMMEEYYTTLNNNGDTEKEQGNNPGESPAGATTPDTTRGTPSTHQENNANNNSSGPVTDNKPTGEEEKGNQDSVEGTPNTPGHGFCDPTSEHKQHALDAAGIPRAEQIDVTLAQQDTHTRLTEHLKNSNIGDSALNQALTVTLNALKPPVADWRVILRRIIGTLKTNKARGGQYRTYRRPSRRTDAVTGGIILPSTHGTTVTGMFAVDTSGSMSDKDFGVFIGEVRAALKELSRTNRAPVPMFAVDTVIKGDPQLVTDPADFDFTGGGGTNMAPAFAYVRSLEQQQGRNTSTPRNLPPAPDAFVLATDGHIPWTLVVEELQKPHQYTPIILITTETGYQRTPQTIKNHAHVIDCH